MTEPAPRREPTPPPEPTAAPEPRLEPTPTEILRPDRYGLYSRLYLASRDPHDAPSYLNPDPNITVGIGTLALDPSGERNYTDVTKNLSEGERRETWNEFIKEFSFEDAYEKWNGGVTKSIKTTTDKRIINAIKAITGKDAADFTEEDVKTRLYNPFAKGKSDTTPFVGSVIGSYRIDGKVDVERLKADMEGIKWVASQLFGKKSSGLVVAAAELEAGMQIDGRKTIEILLQDTTTNRLNKLNEEEKEILTTLLESFEEPEEEPDQGGAPLDTSEEEDEEEPTGAATEPDIKGIPNYDLPEGTTPENIVPAIKSVLIAQTSPRFNVIVPIGIGKEFVVSTFVGKVRVNKIIDYGTVERGPNDETILIGIRLERSLARDITVDLILKNEDGLKVKIGSHYEGGDDEFEREVEKLQPNSVNMVNEDIAKDDPNPSPLKADKISLSSLGDSFLITFHRIDPLDPVARQLNQPT